MGQHEEKREKKREIAVSIIIPVYNVAKWLDQCMESVVGQTFANFEVLLVDDGSTDGSGLKCDDWARMDNRIRVIHKENEGPSLARNRGIQEAEGEYLSFLDADDWVEPTFLEKMYAKVKECDADLAECDVWRYNNNSHTKTYCSCHGSVNMDYSREEHMIYGYGAIWNLLVRREFWLQNRFCFKDCHSEAFPVYSMLMAKADKIGNVKEALYYYRRFREGSLTTAPKKGKEKKAVGIKAFEYLMENFRERGMDITYGDCLERMIKYKMTTLMSAFFCRMSAEDYKTLSENYYGFLAEYFPKTRILPDSLNADSLKEGEIKYLTWGGFNLNRILWYAKYLHDPYGRFNFSSLIALMNPVGENRKVSHKVRYREMMIEREVGNAFWDILKEVRPDYVIMDLIEERFGVVKCGNGYLTKSDAFDGADIERVEVTEETGGQTISAYDERRIRLWEESALRFIRRLEQEYPGMGIILVKNYLAEKVGDIQRQEFFGNIEEIRRMNGILAHYYDYFQKHCRNIKVVEASECGYYFTDRQYEYGAVPSHLNELVNKEIAGRIERCIGA